MRASSRLLCALLMLGSSSAAAAPLRPTGLHEPRFPPCYAPVPTRTAEAATGGGGGGGGANALFARIATWPTIDLAPDAANAGVPSAFVEHARAPVGDDPFTTEPLRGDPADLAKVRGVFARANKQVVRIAVWGDSHTMADRLPGQLRRRLQARYGDVGPGFVFPFGGPGLASVGRASLCQTGSWTLDQLIRAPGVALGPAGLAATASAPTDGAWVSVEDEARPGAKAWVSVLVFDQPGGGTLSLTVDDSEPLRVPTAGAAAPRLVRIELPLGPHDLRMHPEGDGPVRMGGLVVDRDSVGGGGVSVDGLGNGGRPLSAWKIWDHTTMRAWVAERPYDLVVMSAGSADGGAVGLTEDQFRATTRESLARFREVMPDAACVILGPADRGLGVDDTHVTVWMNHAWINQVLREEAPAAHCVTWDLQAALGGPGRAVALRAAGIVNPDLLHFTPAGARLIGGRLADLLDPR